MSRAGALQVRQATIIDEGAGLAPALAACLHAQSIPAQVVALNSPALAEADWVIALGGLKPLQNVDAALAVNREAFQLAKILAPRFSKHGGIWVSVQDTGGDFGLSGTDALQAWTGGLAGLIKTAAQEWPKASLKAIDIHRAGRSLAVIAAQLAEEILFGGLEGEVGLTADNQRQTLQLVVEEAPQPAHTPVLPAHPVIIATGGARGVTATTLIELAKACQPRLALLGRSRFDAAGVSDYQGLSDQQIQAAVLKAAQVRGEKLTPKALKQSVERILANREIAATLQAIAQAGGEAQYLAVDVNDAAAVHAAVAGIRQQWGAIHGIVHGAGVLADAWIENKTVEQFERVFTTKIQGLRALLAATQPEERQLMALFSSVAARAGNTGQCDYAMANEILNKVADAEARRYPQHIVKSFNWGPWEGGMVTPALKNLFAQRGIALIPLQTGADWFVREVQSRPGHDVEVVMGGESLQSDAAKPDLTVQIRVDQAHYPYLLSHQVRNKPVLPMVLALEWMVRLIRQYWPAGALFRLQDLQVRKGVILDALATGHWLQLAIQAVPDSQPPQLALTLASWASPEATQPVVHYTAQAVMLTKALANPLAGAQVTGLQPAPWPALYSQNVLFHGPDFQMLQQVQGVSAQGLVVSLKGAATMPWPAQTWQTDMAALDGALQAAILWGLLTMGTGSLPMKIGQFIPLQPWGTLPRGELQCVLLGRKHSARHTVSDILLQQADGQAFAVLQGVELYATPA